MQLQPLSTQVVGQGAIERLLPVHLQKVLAQMLPLVGAVHEPVVLLAGLIQDGFPTGLFFPRGSDLLAQLGRVAPASFWDFLQLALQIILPLPERFQAGPGAFGFARLRLHSLGFQVSALGLPLLQLGSAGAGGGRLPVRGERGPRSMDRFLDLPAQGLVAVGLSVALTELLRPQLPLLAQAVEGILIPPQLFALLPQARFDGDVLSLETLILVAARGGFGR
jgi:hypothetical protein